MANRQFRLIAQGESSQLSPSFFSISPKEIQVILRSAILSFSDEEINRILKLLDLPVQGIKVKSGDGKVNVTVRKGISFRFCISFAADGRHLSATMDAGVLANPFVGSFLDRILESTSEWGVSRAGRTLVFDPHAALMNAGITGEISVDRTAVGAGELVIVLQGDLLLDQFVNTARKS